MFDSPTLQSTPESGGRAVRRGQRPQGALAVDTLSHLPALRVTAADEQDRVPVKHLSELVELALVDPGYTGERSAADAAASGIAFEVVKLLQAERGFMLLPRRWVVERSLGWRAGFRRLTRDHERLRTTLRGLHFIAFACACSGASARRVRREVHRRA